MAGAGAAAGAECGGRLWADGSNLVGPGAERQLFVRTARGDTMVMDVTGRTPEGFNEF